MLQYLARHCPHLGGGFLGHPCAQDCTSPRPTGHVVVQSDWYSELSESEEEYGCSMNINTLCLVLLGLVPIIGNVSFSPPHSLHQAQDLST